MKILYQEPNTTIYCGHALDLKELPAESVDMCMTSPPYWGLRSYKTEPQIWDSKDGCVHKWGSELGGRRKRTDGDVVDMLSKEATKSASAFNSTGGSFCSLCGAWRGELGLEPTIELYIKHLIQIFNEVKRVLKKTGTCWVNIDDSYAGSWGDSGHRPERDGKAGYQREKNSEWYQREGHPQFNPPTATIKSVPPKSLCLIPSRFALAMVESGWILRNDIVWNKPNPMPESVKDRFTGSWEHLFFFTKNRRYYFEQQFEPVLPQSLEREKYGWNGAFKGRYDIPWEKRTECLDQSYTNPLGRNKRDVWEITTQPYPEAHFATFPEKLCETPILAGCPSMICKKCGKAREKIYDSETEYKSYWGQQGKTPKDVRDIGKYGQTNDAMDGDRKRSDFDIRLGPVVKHIDKGYTDCGCNAGFVPGVILDPFCGSGTTLAVAKRLGRKGIGIDISGNYCKLAVKRIQGISLPMEFN